jgi:septal ring factor EnvC (AmiA/AmiB activator)
MGAIILLLLLVVFFQPSTSNSSKYDKEKKEIDSLQNVIGELKDINQELGNEIHIQTKIMDSLNQEIKSTEKELTQTRIYYGNKIKDLNSSSPSELNEFFSERYQ